MRCPTVNIIWKAVAVPCCAKIRGPAGAGVNQVLWTPSLSPFHPLGADESEEGTHLTSQGLLASSADFDRWIPARAGPLGVASGRFSRPCRGPLGHLVGGRRRCRFGVGFRFGGGRAMAGSGQTPIVW